MNDFERIFREEMRRSDKYGREVKTRVMYNPVTQSNPVEAAAAKEEPDSVLSVVGKGVWNGANSLAKGVSIGITNLADLQADNLNDPDSEELKRLYPEAGKTIQEATQKAAEEIINNPYLARTNVNYGDSTGLKLLGDVSEQVPQLAVMGLTGAVPGAAVMGLMSAGNTYEEARNRGMSHRDARNAGIMDAATETPLEYVGAAGLGKLARVGGKALGTATGSQKIVQAGKNLEAKFGKIGGWLEPADPLEKRSIPKAVLHGVLSEAPTEFVQQFAQQASLDTFDPKVSRNQLIYNATINPDTWKDAGYAGLIGGLTGAGAAAITTPIHNRQIDSYKKQVEQQTAAAKEFGKPQAAYKDTAGYQNTANPEYQNTVNTESETQDHAAEQQPVMPSYYDNFAPDIQEAIYKHATAEVPPHMVAAIIQQESGGDRTAESKVGARGLMQLMPGTAEDMKVANSFDVDDNVRGGVAYYTKLKHMFGGSDVIALAAYNAGEGQVQEWLKTGQWDGTHIDQIPFGETRNYVKTIMKDVSKSGGQFVYNGVTPQQQQKEIAEQEARNAAVFNEFNAYANSKMAVDYALELARTSSDPKLVNQINKAERLKDTKGLEKIARDNGYVDEDLTPENENISDRNIHVTDVSNNRVTAANPNHTTQVENVSTQTNETIPPSFNVQRNNLPAPNNIVNRIAETLAHNTIDIPQNVNQNTTFTQNASVPVEQAIKLLPQQKQLALLENSKTGEIKLLPQSQIADNALPEESNAAAQEVNSLPEENNIPLLPESEDIKPVEETKAKEELVQSLAQQISGAKKEEPLFTPTAALRPNAQEYLNNAAKKIMDGGLPTREEAQAVLADLDHIPESKLTNLLKKKFGDIVRRDFSSFPRAEQNKLRKLAKAEDTRRAKIEFTPDNNPFLNGSIFNNNAVKDIAKRAASGDDSVMDIIQNMKPATEQVGKTKKAVKANREEAAQELNDTDEISLAEIKEKIHELVKSLDYHGLTKDVKTNPKNGSFSVSHQVGETSNHLRVMGVLKPNSKGGDVVFQFKEQSKKVGEIKFTLAEFCQNIGDHFGNGHWIIAHKSILPDVFYNSAFYKNHFETPLADYQKKYVSYKQDNENPPRAEFFMDGVERSFKQLITAYDEKTYQNDIAENVKVADNKGREAARDFADEHLIIGTVTNKGITENKQLKNKIVDTMREGATDNGQVTAADERRMGQNDAGTKEEVGSDRRETTGRNQKGHRAVSENAVNGRAEEILRMDGFRRGRELSDGEGQEADSGTGRQHLVPKKGQEFVSYVKKIIDNAKVLVGEPRTKALKEAGEESGSSSITDEEFNKAKKQMLAQDRILRKWVDANGDAKKHNENNSRRVSLEQRILSGYYKEGRGYAHDKQAYLILGLPAAGKSSLADPLSVQKKALIVDSDEFKKRLPEFENGAGANYVHEESADMANALMDRAIKDGTNIVYPVVGKTPKSLQEKIDKLKDGGYDIHLAYVDLPMEKAQGRAINRYILEGRLVGLDYINGIGDKALVNFNDFKNKEGITDYAFYDNDVKFGEPPKLVEGTDYLNKDIDLSSENINNEDKKTADNQVKKGVKEDDTGRTERRSGEYRGLGKENESEGTNVQSGSENSNAERGMGKEHLVPVERTTLLRSGKDKNDGQIRESDSGNLRDSGSGTKDEVQLHASDSDKRSDSGRTGVSSSRRTVGGRDDTSGGDTGHEDGRADSVGRDNRVGERTEQKQSGEPTERVETESKKNNARPKPEAIRRGRFYSTAKERKAYTEALSNDKERISRNKTAMETYLRLTDNGRITDMSSVVAKPKDLKALSEFSGWGGLTMQLKKMRNSSDDWLQEHFSDEEITKMINSTDTAYFTPPSVVEFMWKSVEKMGLQKNARILEPSMGIGNFIMQLPNAYKDSAHITGIELDKITGEMAQILYGADGKTNIRVQGYENNRSADNSFDLVIGNVPFSTTKFKTGEKRFDVYKPLLHDFFFLKAVKQTRPGGVIAFITTSGTMDKVDSRVRKAIASEADLIEAYRLPNNTFAGTNVVADVLFLQKRHNSRTDVSDVEWTKSVRNTEHETTYAQNIYTNQYFLNHPDHVLGTLGVDFNSRFQQWKLTVNPNEGENISDVLSKAIRKMPKGVINERTNEIADQNLISTEKGIKVGSIYERDGKLYKDIGGDSKEVSDKELDIKTDKDKRSIMGLLRLTNDYMKLLEKESKGEDDSELRARVKKGYTIARKGNKTIRSSKAYKAIIKAGDGRVSVLSSLEDANGTASEIMNHSVIRTDKVTKNPSIQEAVIMSSVGGDVDVEKVAKLSHKSVDDVKKQMIKENLAFVTPNGNWQTKEKYINGNIAAKLDEAREALAYGNKDMEKNIKALEDVLPERIPMNAVTVGFGVAWIEPQVYKDFIIKELYGEDVDDYQRIRIESSGGIQVSMAGGTCSMQVDIRKLPYGHNGKSKTWYIGAENSRDDINMNKIVNAAISNKELTVLNKEKYGKDIIVTVNEDATDRANGMVQKLLDDWQEYVRTGSHKEELADSYNWHFNSFYTPTFDGSHMTFPGLRKEKNGEPFDLRKHQKDACYKGLVQGRCVFAHEVGTGKTNVMGALAMESKRLGLATKTLILAKSSNYKQVSRDIQEEYPGAKILTIDEKGNGAGGQLAEAMIGDWDMVIAPHSQMSLFLLSDEGYKKVEEKIRNEIREEMEDVATDSNVPEEIWDLIDGNLESTDKEVKDAIRKLRGDDLRIKGLVQNLTRRIALLEKYGESVKSSKHIPFEQLGVDQILVDEAHEFKKPGLVTRSEVKGIETGTSDMALKLRIITDNVIERYGRGVHLFTGTPITNTACELYQMMRYVMKPEMEAGKVSSFDSWFAQNAKAESALVRKPTGEYEEEVRFMGFKNLPELRRMYEMNFDFVKAKDMPEFKPREVDGYTLLDKNIPESVKEKLENGRTEGAKDVPYHKIINVRSEMSPEMNEFAERIERAAQEYSKASGKEKKEMSQRGHEGDPLVAMRKLSQLSLDPRLVNGNDYAGSKIQNCADNIFKEYGKHDKVSQAVFVQEGVSDTRSVVKRGVDGEALRDENGKSIKEKVIGWNVAQALKNELVNRGIPENEIAVLSSDEKALTELKKKYKEQYKLSKQPTTDELKKLVADEVNDCKIKVVIGTRSMLGTGINMQHNLKAIHQLDAPWMPGELAQSQGRAVRQRNQWNTVNEYRYVTDLDTIRWTRLAIKSSFITAITDSEDVRRDLEMDESMGSNVGGAEGDIYLTLSFSSQDNRLMEQKRLQKKVKKLESAQKAFYRAKELQEAEAMQAQKMIPQWEAAYNGLKALSEKQTEDPLVIAGRKKNETELDALRRLDTELRQKRNDKLKLGTFRGLTISAHKNGYNTDLFVGDGKDEVLIRSTDGSFSGATLRALVNTGLPNKINNMKAEIEGAKRSISAWELEKDVKFSEEEALEKARSRRDAIIEDIKRNPEKPPEWLRQEVPINSTVKVDGKPILIRSYLVGKNKDGERVHYLIDDEGDAYHISQIRDYQTGLNPYESYLQEEPKDIKIYERKDVHNESGDNSDGDVNKSEVDLSTDEKTDDTKYSIGEDENTHRYNLSDIKRSFRGQEVTQSADGFEVKLKNGRRVTIHITGRVTRADGKSVRGMYRNGEITLTDLANPFTLGHEKLHFAKDCLYTEKEWNFIAKKTKQLLAREGNRNPTDLEIEERAADWYSDWEQKRVKPSGVIQRLFHTLQDFLSKVTGLVHQNVNNTFNQLRNGKLYNRPMTDNRGKTIKYSTAKDVDEAIVSTRQDIAEDTEQSLNMFTKAMNQLSKRFSKKSGKASGVTVEMDENSFNWIKYGMMTPDHLAADNETLAVFTGLGKEASRTLQRLRDDVDDKIKNIAKSIEGKTADGKERRDIYNSIIEEGEANGEEYTVKELQDEGIDEGIISAYRETRKLYDDYYVKVDQIKRGMTSYHKTVTEKQFRKLENDKFVENLESKKLASGRYEVRYDVARKYFHNNEAQDGADLKELLKSRYADVSSVRDENGSKVNINEIQDGESYRVDYVSISEPMHKVRGYFHHLFEDWLVLEKVTDPSGNEYYEPVGSYRSRKEAVTSFSKMQDLLKESKTFTREELEAKGYDRNVIAAYEQAVNDDSPTDKREYVIRPKLFRMPIGGGVALSNIKYEKAIRAIEDKYEVSGEEAREMAKGILKRKEGHRFFGATMERNNQQGYSQDMLRVLHMYTTQATRYVALEKFKNESYKQFEKFFGVPVDESKGSGLQGYIKKYIDDVNGNPTRIEEIMNQTLNAITGGKLSKWFGTDRPAMVLSNKEMQIAAVLKLGLLNVSSAAINLTQLSNAMTHLGIKPFFKVHWAGGRFTDAEKKFLKDVGVDTQLGLDTGAGYDKTRGVGKLDKFTEYSLMAFTWSEQKVRQITALMAWHEAKKKGMSYSEAVEFAQDANDKANFDYGINNAPLFIRAGGPVTQMLFQFMKFPVNQISFMSNIVRKGTNAQRARLMIPLLLAGANGVPGWAAIICPMLAAMVAAASGDDYDDPDLYLKKKCYQWAGNDPFWKGFLHVGFYGFPALGGVNVGRRVGIGDFGGDVSKTLRGERYGYDLGDFAVSLAGGILAQSILQASTQYNQGNTIEAIKAMSPAVGNLAQAIVGERKTTRGRLATKYTSTNERVMKALGFMPLDETIENEKTRMIKEERGVNTKTDTKLIDAYIRAKENNDKEEMYRLLEKLEKRKISLKRVTNEEKRKKQTQLDRAIENAASKRKRRELAETYNW